MPEIKRAFNVGKMNRDLDDRLVPPGQYREALNVNIGQSEGSDVGAIENLLGNESVATPSQFAGLADAKCIGAHKDNGTECIYFFVTDHLGTSFLESMQSNTPTICFLNKTSYLFEGYGGKVPRWTSLGGINPYEDTVITVSYTHLTLPTKA